MAGVINQRSAGLIDSLNQHVFHILGCGAIGSSAATQLSRMGAENFVLYDMDKVETPNIGVSQYGHSHIGMSKTSALSSLIKDINPESEITEMDGLFETFMYYNEDDIIILGFDSMESRLEAMKTCLSFKGFKPRLLIDGRMGAEHYQQYTFINPKLKEYQKTWYSDEEGSSEPCNMKATSYCSNMAGSFIANTVRKVLTKQPYEAALSFNFPTAILEKNTLYK
jgi:molybdopterin/thiamine biosynthesis adenylyltransferase